MKKLTDSCELIRSKVGFNPTVGVILGSGLGKLIEKIQNPIIINYRDIPNFLNTGIEGHSGNLVFGQIGEINLVLMQGRNHYYEGHTMQDITYPIRVMKSLGVENLITTNAVGGINKTFKVGDIMLVNDHINLMGSNPLIGELEGEKFIDMSSVYDRKLIEVGLLCGHKNNFGVKEGILTALSGPTYETPAEYRFLKLIGSDAVGMSTIPEVIVGKQLGMRIFSMSIVTNVVGSSDVNHNEVQTVANQSVNNVWLILNDVIKCL
jgi:purine-nucleoside phosphorylase